MCCRADALRTAAQRFRCGGPSPGALGAHIFGVEATELIQGFVIAMNLETTEEELIRTIFPHPTLSETMHESVLAAYGRAIHV